MSQIFLSAAHKSSGKTTLSIGINALARRYGRKPVPFKKGPDYIDPIWLGMAAGTPCYNLDNYVASDEEVLHSFRQQQSIGDLAIIEGTKGLYDGLDLDGRYSNAEMAKMLNAPVVLIIDCQGMIRGIAPLLLGYLNFDPQANIAGVILNRVGGPRHESKLRATVKKYTDLPILGAVQNSPKLNLQEQHLGLVPGNEDSAAQEKIEQIADVLDSQIQIETLLTLADNASSVTVSPPASNAFGIDEGIRNGLKIGIARDQAFGFYYPSDLHIFNAHGAELVPINMCSDAHLPDDLDGLFIGGGFPERHCQQLSANQSMLNSLKQAITNGLACYAECGGLMLLTEAINWRDQHYPMAGVIPSECTLHAKPKGRGYVHLEVTEQHPWQFNSGMQIRAHEFHYSSLDCELADAKFAYKMQRGTGVDGLHDGISMYNLLASYGHLRHTSRTPWVTDFLRFVSKNSTPGLSS